MKKIVKIVAWSLLGLAVVLVFVLLIKKNAPQKEVLKIETVAQTDTLENKTILTGRLNPRNEILLKPQLSGIIAEINHEPGDYVKQGEVIARIEVVPDMMQSSNADSQVKLNEINFKTAKERYLRDKNLFEKGVVAKEEFESSSANYFAAKENLQSSKEARDIVQTGISSRTQSTSTTLVRSTTSGMILDIPVKVGTSVIQANTFNDGTTIASVANMQDVVFTGEADETIVGKLEVGNTVSVSVGALGEKRFDARIEYISPKGNEKNGTMYFDVRAAVNVPKESGIRAGYSANGEVVLNGVYNVLSLPESCISYEGNNAYVEKILSEKPLKTERIKVKTGLSNGVIVEIKGGLKVGDKVKGSTF